jgi:uncharacterized protein YjaG (DUF416 family)
MMELRRFDEPSLIRALSQLPRSLRVVFAAAAAERLLPAYMSWSHLTGQGDALTMAALLDRLWLDLQGDKWMAASCKRTSTR